MFSKDKFECLLKEFICLTGSNNITYEELQNQVFEFTHQRYDLQELIWGIIKCKFNDQHVKSFLEYVDWESFVINEIYRILDKTADISIYINSEQKKFIYQYCKQIANGILFHLFFVMIIKNLNRYYAILFIIGLNLSQNNYVKFILM